MPKVTSKSASKQKVSGGGKGMAGFKAVGSQKPGVTSVSGSGGSKSPGAKITGGGKGMAGFNPVAPQKSGRTGQR